MTPAESIDYWERRWSDRALRMDRPVPVSPLQCNIALDVIEPHSPFRRLIDVGCGWGRWFDVFENLCLEYVGVDCSQSAIDRCRKLYPDEYFVHFDALETICDVDCIFGCTVLIHVPEAESLMRRLAEISAPGAHAFFWEAIHDEPTAAHVVRRSREQLRACWEHDWQTVDEHGVRLGREPYVLFHLQRR